MPGYALAAGVGLLVGLVTHVLVRQRVSSPMWLTLATGMAAALLGTVTAQLTGAAASLDAMPAVLLAPLFFAGVGIAVLAFTTDRTAHSRR